MIRELKHPRGGRTQRRAHRTQRSAKPVEFKHTIPRITTPLKAALPHARLHPARDAGEENRQCTSARS